MVAGREDVRTLARPVVALSASTVPPSGRPSNRSSGHPVSRCPDGQASGVRGAAALSGPRWALEWLGVVGRPSVGRSGSTCRRGPWAAWSPAGIGPNGKRWCDVGRPWLARGSTVAQVRRLGRLPGCGAAWPPDHGPGPRGGDHAEWSVGWWWSRVVQLRRPTWFGGEQPAAAARPRRMRSAVRQVLRGP
jgi:hypothetical protein